VSSVHQTTSLRTTLLSPYTLQQILSKSSRGSRNSFATMTRAQQTVSIGLLFASVYTPYDLHQAAPLTGETALSGTVPPAHSTSKHNFRRDNTSCALYHFNLVAHGQVWPSHDLSQMQQLLCDCFMDYN
jgi:hypothetical protein